MYVYCVEKLGLDPDKVNVNGGAIALGRKSALPARCFAKHAADVRLLMLSTDPLGCTGVRQVATGIAEARRKGQ